MLNNQGREPWAIQVIARVNAHLEDCFSEGLAHALTLSPRAPELVKSIAELTMRGGKRLRPLLIHAGYCASAPLLSERDMRSIVTVGAAIELLQSYLLVQDDWMDGDEQRRGGPSTIAAMRRQHKDPQLAASLTILASDVAIGLSLELLHAARFPSGRSREALSAFGSMHLEVVFGQQLDLLAHEDVTLTQHLKTGSYTMRGPLTLGALLADAREEQLQALMRFATPAGIAFQLRDDLLGMFGDPAVTGKPVGQDLLQGKYTALIAEANGLLSKSERAYLDAVRGNPSASPSDVQTIMRLLQTCGARARVEAALAGSMSEAHAALQSASCLRPEGVGMLTALLDRSARRDR